MTSIQHISEVLKLVENYLVERGIDSRGTVGRTIVLPAIREARRLAEQEAKDKPQADAGLVEEIKQLSESRYCQALDYAKRTECLGWEYKSKNGLFGVGEFKAHEKVNTLLGEHKGLHEAAVLLSRYHPAHSTTDTVGKMKEAHNHGFMQGMAVVLTTLSKSYDRPSTAKYIANELGHADIKDFEGHGIDQWEIEWLRSVLK